MNDGNLASAEAYYLAMKHNDPENMALYLHENVRVTSPLGEVAGKERVLESAKGLMIHIMDMDIKARFASGNQVMLVYVLECSHPIGTCPTAALMTFKDGLIVSNNLFFDPRPFEKLQP
ncbi:MAG: nuclear transport factor 2 family protein [Candidatus Acidiferrales bacterium]